MPDKTQTVTNVDFFSRTMTGYWNLLKTSMKQYEVKLLQVMCDSRPAYIGLEITIKAVVSTMFYLEVKPAPVFEPEPVPQFPPEPDAPEPASPMEEGSFIFFKCQTCASNLRRKCADIAKG